MIKKKRSIRKPISPKVKIGGGDKERANPLELYQELEIPLTEDGSPIDEKEGVNQEFSRRLEDNLERVKVFAGDTADLNIRQFTLGITGIKAAVIHMQGLTDMKILNEHVVEPLILKFQTDLPIEELKGRPLKEVVTNHIMTSSMVESVDTLDQAFLPLLSGDTIVLLDTVKGALVVGNRGWTARAISEPQTESVIRGPRDGFVETLMVNMTQIRRRIKDPNLTMKVTQVGRRTKTDIAVVYLKGIVDPELLAEVEKRIEAIDVDAIWETGFIEQLIEDNPLSPLPQVQTTERPDKVAASVLEGRVAILVDNTPFALIVPVTLPQFYQSPEDYYDRWPVGSFTRVLRFIASLLATMTPAIYISIVAFHPEMIPTELVLTIAAARAGVPFPAIVEALVMELAFELLREAGARLPKPIGMTVSIVGGLVIGDAAVRAGLASPTMIIVVALTAIASFTIPQYNVASGLRLIRFPVMLLAAVFGMFGVMIGFIWINMHLVSIQSFGKSYLGPIVPWEPKDWKDSLVRLPIQLFAWRPVINSPQDEKRMGGAGDSNGSK